MCLEDPHPLLAELEATLVPAVPQKLDATPLKRAVSSNLPHDVAYELGVLAELLRNTTSRSVSFCPAQQ